MSKTILVTWADGRQYEMAAIIRMAGVDAADQARDCYLRAMISVRPDLFARLTPLNAPQIADELKCDTTTIIAAWDGVIEVMRDGNWMPLHPTTCLLRQALTLACKALWLPV